MPPPVVAPTTPTFSTGTRTNPLSAQRTINEGIQRLNSSNVIGFPSDLPKYYMLIIENGWSGIVSGLTSGFGQLTSERGYRLPLPLQLTDNHEVVYDHHFNWLNILRGGLAAVSGGISFPIGGIGQGLQGAIGFSVNNFKMVTLDAPQFRQYTMEWKLAPRNLRESENIRSIYLGIKKGMHPSMPAGRLVFQFPKIYWVGFYPNAGYLFKFKPCVIQGCQIDYQGGNPQPVFYSGEENPPESIILRLSFLELEYWIDRDFTNATSNNPFDVSNWFSFAP